MNKQEKKVVWSNYGDNYYEHESEWKDAYIEHLEANNYERREIEDLLKDENNVYNYFIEENDFQLDCERDNLSVIKEYDNDIVIIANLGLWDGRHSGYAIAKTRKVSELFNETFNNDCDYYEFYVDKHKDFCCRETHHDGTNELLFRVFKKGISETQRDNFLDKLYYGKATRKDITRYTESIGKDIAKVYGW